MIKEVFVPNSLDIDRSVDRIFVLLEDMAQACLTQYFTPKRSRRSATVLANGEPIKPLKRKLQIEDENNENFCSNETSSQKKRRISPSKPTEGFLPGCDLDQIGKAPLSRKNVIETDEKKVKSFQRRKQRLAKVADVNELHEHLKAVRTHIEQVKSIPIVTESETTMKIPPAHERFAHLLVEKPSMEEISPITPSKKFVSPADLRRYVQVTENERLQKILSKVDPSIIESLPTTPSKKIAGVNNRLLEQIRLKEESKNQMNSLEKTGLVKNEQQRLKTSEMFQHLREAVEIIDQFFTTERQVALELDRVQLKLIELHSARFTSDQGNEFVDFIFKSMSECACGYFLQMKLRNKQYMKINRMKFSMIQLNEYIEKKLIEFGE